MNILNFWNWSLQYEEYNKYPNLGKKTHPVPVFVTAGSRRLIVVVTGSNFSVPQSLDTALRLNASPWFQVLPQAHRVWCYVIDGSRTAQRCEKSAGKHIKSPGFPPGTRFLLDVEGIKR